MSEADAYAALYAAVVGVRRRLDEAAAGYRIAAIGVARDAAAVARYRARAAEAYRVAAALDAIVADFAPGRLAS